MGVSLEIRIFLLLLSSNLREKKCENREMGKKNEETIRHEKMGEKNGKIGRVGDGLIVAQ